MTFKSTPSMQRETRHRADFRHKGEMFKSTPSMQRETHKVVSNSLLSAFKSTPSMQRETKFNPVEIPSHNV